MASTAQLRALLGLRHRSPAYRRARNAIELNPLPKFGVVVDIFADGTRRLREHFFHRVWRKPVLPDGLGHVFARHIFGAVAQVAGQRAVAVSELTFNAVLIKGLQLIVEALCGYFPRHFIDQMAALVPDDVINCARWKIARHFYAKRLARKPVQDE